jgi:hypothetical protein
VGRVAGLDGPARPPAPADAAAGGEPLKLPWRETSRDVAVEFGRSGRLGTGCGPPVAPAGEDDGEVESPGDAIDAGLGNTAGGGVTPTALTSPWLIRDGDGARTRGRAVGRGEDMCWSSRFLAHVGSHQSRSNERYGSIPTCS